MLIRIRNLPKKSSIIAFAITVWMTGSAISEVKTGDILDGIKSKDAISLSYLAGITDGISWYNSSNKNIKNQFYCPPDNMAFNLDNYIKILSDFVARKPDEKDNFTGLSMMFALRTTFPCKQ